MKLLLKILCSAIVVPIVLLGLAINIAYNFVIASWHVGWTFGEDFLDWISDDTSTQLLDQQGDNTPRL